MEEVTPEERREAILSIVAEYEEFLGETLKTSDKFEVNRLPPVIQDSVKLVTAKSPAFSNISACTTVNYLFTHLVSQLRPVIMDISYSPDSLGINYYGINLATSGSGKDASLNTMKSACKTAFDMILDVRKKNEEDRAKAIALHEKKKDDPNATEHDLDYSDYSELIRELPPTSIEAKSTRGGAVNVITRMQNQQFGNLGIVSNEFGLALKQNNTIEELLETLGSLFDMGVTEQQAFKTVDVREQSIEGMYPNTLMHSSPKIVFGNPKVRDAIFNLFHTMLARRCFLSMPSDRESIENNVVPTSIKEVRELANARRVTVSTLSSKLDGVTADVVRTMLADDLNRIVSFEEDAGELYIDYFEYNLKKAELEEDSSIQQVELNGRAFKTARLAAMWSLMENSNRISKDILESAIYFAQYNSRYLEEFVLLASAKGYRLLGDKFKRGDLTQLSLDGAIVKGYVTAITNEFRELLDPMNSYLAKVGIVSYSQEDKTFYYSPFKMVEETGDYGISYTKVEGVAKEDRIKYLDNFQTYKMCTMKHLGQMLTMDTIYNVFRYNDGPNKNGDMITMNRNQKYLASNTKLLSIDVDDSEMPIEEMHGYLSEFKHLIATTSDVNNKHKFRILLPVNIEIDGSQQGLYRCIMRKVSEALLIQPDTTSFNPAQPMYGYDGAELFVNEEGLLYDISDIISECVQDDTSGIVERTVPKTTQAKQKLVKEIMANANQVFDYVINCQRGTGSLSLARASMHMRDSGFGPDQYRQVINYLNSMWQVPMNEDRLEKIIDQYISKMEG